MVEKCMIRLTENQRAAVIYPGNLLLTACPGSGKTRTLTAKLVAEIDAVRRSARYLCCITYTNTAVQEIEQRARDQLQPGDDSYYNISTIHSFCLNEILRPYGWLCPRYSGEIKVLTRENEDFEGICQHAAAQAGFHNLSNSDYEAFEGLSVDAEGELIGLAARNNLVRASAPYYWARCETLGYTDFSMIIYESYKILRDAPHVARTLSARYKWFLIDEFQDTTSLQIDILKLLYSAGRSLFFIVGDIAQSIYSFAGARPELVEPFGKHIGAEMGMSLIENFRSSQRIVAHAEKLISRIAPMVASGPDSECEFEPKLISGGSVFNAIMQDFLPQVSDAGISLARCTVLAKDWGSLYKLGRQLRLSGIPIVGPGARPYRRSRLFSQMAEQLCGALSAPVGRYSRQLERALYHMILEITGQRSTDVFSFKGRLTLIRLMHEAHRISLATWNAVVWLDEMSASAGSILQEAEFISQAQAGLLYASVQEMKADMQRQDVDLRALSVEDLGLFANPANALRLSTIHYAKGREFDAVAIIGVRKGWFPHRYADDIESEKRQFYVGLTRARKILVYISESDKYGNPPSQFLGADCIDIL